MSSARFVVGDVFEEMAKLPDGSVDLVLCSPPFLALRSYLPADHPLKAKEIGSEPTPAVFLDTLLALTAEWRRVLAPHGSICVELGDTYSGSGNDGGPQGHGISGNGGARWRDRLAGEINEQPRKGSGWPLDKSLCGIPHLYHLSLTYGRNLLTGEPSPAGQWRVRNVVAWCRPNPPVGALGDKFRPATSYLTVACVGRSRYFDLDAVRGPYSENTNARTAKGVDRRENTTAKANAGGNNHRDSLGIINNDGAGAPPLDYWEIPTAPFAGAHYATFPPALCVRPIQAMCPQRVCRACGKPSERITSDRSAFERQPELAAHIKERREVLGVTSDEINGWFGYKEIAKNWERTDEHGAAIPNPKDWIILSERLGLSSEFDSLVLGDRRWTESTTEYVNQTPNGRAVERGRKTESPAHALRADAVRRDLGWSDCGHNDYRRGLVLDPFCGSGTTLAVAVGHGRDAIGIDLDPRNADLARERVGMFLEVEERYLSERPTVDVPPSREIA